MHKTGHIQKRMSQRGITQDMVALVMAHGDLEGDKVVLGRKQSKRLLRAYQTLVKVLDKGGIAVVTQDDALITTYNFKEGRR